MPALRVAVDRVRDRRGDVADEDRLEAGRAAADQRQRRRDARQRGEAVEEIVLRPEHDRRPHDDGLRLRGQHQPFARGLGAGVARGRVLVGADRRDVDQARAMGARRQRHLLGAEGLDGVEALPAALEQDADQIDQHIGVARRRLDRRRVAQIGLHRVDLADAAERLQVAGEVGPAHRDADAVVRAWPARAPRGGRESRSRRRR